MSLHIRTNKPDFQPQPERNPQEELAAAAFRYLNTQAGDEVQSLLEMCGSPADQKILLGEVFELALNPEFGLLNADAVDCRIARDWFAHVNALYRAHADSDAFLNRRSLRMVVFFSVPDSTPEVKMPLPDSAYALLAMSEEICAKFAAALDTPDASSYGRAMASALRRPNKALTALQDAANELRSSRLQD